jgi:hypothetical protein
MWRTAAAPLMKALRQLGFLKLNLRANDADAEDHRVLALFRKRAELKKAYGGLQDEIYRLKDRVKQQEGATQRVQEMLGTLEMRLSDPESGYPALVFYQLRRFWQSGRELIEQFVADLVRQQEERERRAHLAEHNRRQFTRKQTVDADLRGAESRSAEARAALAELQQQRARLTRFWHYFKRRALDQRIVGARQGLVEVDGALVLAREAAEQLEKEQPPEFPGLSMEARRAINLAAIACAEVLCARLAKTELVKLAREATARREVADDYGTRGECERLMEDISRGLKLIQARDNLSIEVRKRSERLKQVARYRNAADTSPTTDSIAVSEGDVLKSEAAGGGSTKMPNVLAEDTWDLFRVLLR